MVTGDEECGGGVKWREKGARGGEDDASIHLYSESMESTGLKHAGR